MKKFMDDDFLLSTKTAAKLFHDHAKNLPVIDYHCHINPEEIAKDKKYDNIAGIWLGGDHYKWRLMRAAGVGEEFITGNAPDEEKFKKYAAAIGKCIGNPVFHWTHLELQRYFGYNGVLSEETAGEVWEHCNSMLRGMSVRSIILQSNVEVICTTDDPADTLEWHKQIANDINFKVKVLPTWRPDRSVNIENSGFIDYLDRLSAVSGYNINTYGDLQDALVGRMKFFSENGCKISDHGLEYIDYLPASESEVEKIFAKRLKGETLSENETRKYKTSIMLFFGHEYSRLGWVMQLHYSCKRNNNPAMYEKLGPDTGYDCISNYAPSGFTADYLGALSKENKLPKTILYSLNPYDNSVIDTIAGCFQDGSVVNKIQHGSAWWFNDHIEGMKNQMISLANNGFLAGFAGMLTDSRSFLSYPRHEYFRRILCSLIGNWVENGEYPNNDSLLSEIVSGISYYNAKKYFGF